MKHPIKVARTSDGRWFVTFSEGRPRFIKASDVDEWRARIQGGSVATTKKARTTKRKHHSSSSTTLRMQGRVELDYDEHEIGWILRGIVEALRGGSGDSSRIFESRDDDDTAAERARNAKLLELGEELAAHFDEMFSYFRISPQEWASWHARVLARGSSSTTINIPASAMQGAGSTPLGGGLWVAPTVGAISSKFGEDRPSHQHEGIDIAAAPNAPVVAPVNMKIVEVGKDHETLGNYIRAKVQRSDGSYDSFVWDEGYVLTFAHLAVAEVKEDDVVVQGARIGLVGSTGRSSGPHLHFAVHHVIDRPGGKYLAKVTDTRTALDPLRFVSAAAIEGRGVPQPPTLGETQALIDGRPANVVIAPGGRVSIGGHGMINSDPKADVGLMRVPAAPPPPSSGYRVANDDGPLDDILDFVRFATSPQVVSTVGTIATLGGQLLGLTPAAPAAPIVSGTGAVLTAGANPISQAIDMAADALEGITWA